MLREDSCVNPYIMYNFVSHGCKDFGLRLLTLFVRTLASRMGSTLKHRVMASLLMTNSCSFHKDENHRSLRMTGVTIRDCFIERLRSPRSIHSCSSEEIIELAVSFNNL